MDLQTVLQFVTAFSSVVFDQSIAPIGRQIGYLFNYRSKIQALKTELQKLKDERDKVQHSVDDAIRKGEEIEAVVERWLSNVNIIIENSENIIRKGEEHAEKGWFQTSCIHLKSRYRVGKGATRESKNVAKLQVEGRFDKVSYRVPVEGIISPVKAYESFESRRHALDGLLEALSDPNITMVGVYGMAGVGKTTLVKEVANKVKQDRVFDIVVMVEVSETQDLKRIQGEIADKLGLEFREETVSGRADRLYDRLKKEKRILIILDNIWEKLDLEDVGIPFGETHQGCKILLTSRDQNVLSIVMDSQKNFGVGILREDEAWILFKKMAGDSVESPDLRSIAVEVAKECAGLPIAIVTVAGALKNKSLPLWKNALRELRRPSSRNFTGMQAVVSSSIVLSYNHLESDELKATFLLCGFMGSSMILDLLKHGIGLGLFHHANTVEEAHDRVHTLLSNLEASGLLLDPSNNSQFAIHDVVRDVAISIAARDWNVFALLRNEVGPKDWPTADCTGISLFYNDISELPEELECPKLRFFYLVNKNPSLRISNNFFSAMKELKVLDLTEMHLPSLPSSIGLLTDLQTLCLDLCSLEDIAIIGQLKKLEILSLLRSNVEQLPKELSQLTRLQLLDLSDCSKLKVIPAGVISSLTRLEQLYMGNSFKGWEDEELNKQASNANLSEVTYLPHLIVLEIHIPETQISLKDLFPEKLDRYKIFIGDMWDWSGKNENSRTLKLKYSASPHLEDGIYKLLKKTEDLYLDELKGDANVLWKLDREGFPKLKHLHVQNSPNIQYIVNSMEEPWVSSKAFPILESLFLQSLINLEKICHGKVTVESFNKLKTIKVRSCGRLENLFKFSMFRCLVQLQEIEVTDCENIAGIASADNQVANMYGEAADIIQLPQLQILILQNLPSLISFVYDTAPSTSQSRSSNPMPLLDEKMLFSNLLELKLSSVNVAKIWPDQPLAMASCIKNLKNLTVEGYDRLKYLFPSSMARTLVQLKTIVIRNCKIMETVIDMKPEEEGETKHFVFPELHDLRLENLPQLNQFCAGKSIELPSLRLMVIRKCHELRAFIPDVISKGRKDSEESARRGREKDSDGDLVLFDEKVGVPNLERLILEQMDKMVHIWHKQLAPDAFSKLDYIALWKCKKLLHVFPPIMINRLQKLDRLRVNLCESVRCIFGREWPNSTGKRIETTTQSTEAGTALRFVFPQVTLLELWDLPELNSFYPGVHITKWPMLRRMHLHGCDSVKILASEFQWFQEKQRKRQPEIPVQQPFFFVNEGTFPNLEELKLAQIGTMTDIWCGKYSSVYFRKLKVLELIGFLQQQVVPPIDFIQLLPNLEKLHLNDAPFERIFQITWLGSREMHPGMISKLSELKLSKLPFLKHLWREELKPDQIFGSLGTVEFKNPVSFSTTFWTLTILEISKCHGLINLMTPRMANCLLQLTKLSITDCESLSEIIGHTGEEVKDMILFNKLKHLGLYSLPSLASFCLGNYTFEFPSLEEVIIRGCPRMRIFSEGVLSTPKLLKIQLTEGEDMGHWNGDLNTTIKRLFRETVTFRGLEHLKLSMFPDLLEVWNRSPILPLEFNTLKSLEVLNCNSLRYLFTPSTAQRLVQLEEMKIQDCTTMVEIITTEEAEEPAVQFTFPSLKSISLESLPSLTSFCSASDTVECTSLENITIKNCPNMITFASVFSGEQELNVNDGRNINYHNNGELSIPIATLFGDKVAFPKLKSLQISGLNNFNKLWSNHISASSLCELQRLEVRDCQKLSVIFPSDVAKGLLKLEKLLVDVCGAEYIIDKDEGDETAQNFVFPQLTSLELGTLLKLKSFYPGMHTTEFPRLTLLHVFHCGELRTFPIEVREASGLVNPVYQPLFSVEKVPDNLEALALNKEDIRMLTYGNSPFNLFPELKFLQLQCFHDDLAVVPLVFLDRLQNLEKLGLSCSSFNELLPYRGLIGGQKYDGIFQWIRNIRLSDLPDLRHIWRQEPQWESVFQNLESFEVWCCDSLISLAPSSASFHNLKTLDVWDCQGLVNLFPLSVARSLVKLTDMRIRNCDLVREAISNEGNRKEEKIIFSKLKRIELDSLTNLSCFCLASCTLKFPSLEEVIVRKCSNLVIFSQGVVAAPLLTRVCLAKEGHQWHWKGDLNATIHLLYGEMEYSREFLGIRWIPPPTGMVKLNIASSLKVLKQLATAGGIFRDHNGNWLEGFSIKFVISEILQAKMFAVREGLRLAVEKGLTDIIVETDSKEVVQLIHHADASSHPLAASVLYCRHLLDSCHSCTIQYVLPEGNSCAEFMENLGDVHDHGFVSYSNPPPGIALLLLVDRARISLCKP